MLINSWSSRYRVVRVLETILEEEEEEEEGSGPPQENDSAAASQIVENEMSAGEGIGISSRVPVVQIPMRVTEEQSGYMPIGRNLLGGTVTIVQIPRARGDGTAGLPGWPPGLLGRGDTPTGVNFRHRRAASIVRVPSPIIEEEEPPEDNNNAAVDQEDNDSGLPGGNGNTASDLVLDNVLVEIEESAHDGPGLQMYGDGSGVGPAVEGGLEGLRVDEHGLTETRRKRPPRRMETGENAQLYRWGRFKRRFVSLLKKLIRSKD
ncbi:hypothetical protein K470DRAFT_57676 [Piedraia hortae CBS 480.64]|uniref:Uncharacterized protein n=1 Tax=Piedraia hortae CBS 480.64 TaxID=1314780 RepID=A0A6A7C0K0_9PEZI|nr:hypothetical protein K470DRAFT_57676 [Piedraia hortae CBS 480.64]